MEINELTSQIIGAAMKVHTALGPGLLESAYEACLAHELKKRGLAVRTQVVLPVVYDIIPITVEQTACPMTFKRIETPCPVFSYRLSAIGFGINSKKTLRTSALSAVNNLCG